MNRRHGHPQKTEERSNNSSGRSSQNAQHRSTFEHHRGIDDNFDLSGSRHQRGERDFDYDTEGNYIDYQRNDRNKHPLKFIPGQEANPPTAERFRSPSNTKAWYYQDADMGVYDEDYIRNDWGAAKTFGNRVDSHFGKGPKGYKRSDELISEEVCDILTRNPRIDASDIEVKVDNSIVTLSGMVESREVKRAAEIAIENITGVEDIINLIRINKSDSATLSSDTFAGSNANDSNH